MCQNIKMLASSRQMSLNCVFFPAHFKANRVFLILGSSPLTVMEVFGSGAPRWRIGPLKSSDVLSLPFTISDP